MAGASAAQAAPAAAAPITVLSPASGGSRLSSNTHRAGTVQFHFVSKGPLDSMGNGGLGTADTAISLTKGDYLIADINGIFSGAASPQLTPLHITGTVATLPPPAVAATISTTTAERFTVSSASWKAGTVRVRNVSESIHFVWFEPVKAGTTDALMTKVADTELHGTPPPSNPYVSSRESVESDVLSPGQQQYFASPVLKPGTYDMECYIAEDMSGLPQFFMGMHTVIVVR